MTTFRLFQATCLKPTYSLRRQLWVSFGITASLTISLVVALAIVGSLAASKLVRDETRQFLHEQVLRSIRQSSQFAAATVSEELDHLRGTSSLLVEIVRDRIVGYPEPGWETDQFVPFLEYSSRSSQQRRRRYPLKSPLLPRDWNASMNVNQSNWEEHLHGRASYAQERLVELHQQQQQDKDGDTVTESQPPIMTPDHGQFLYDYYTNGGQVGTASASFFFQGNCNPAVNNASHWAYYPNCTAANNNGTTGGVVWPTSTCRGLEQKVADIGLLLKPVWESRPDVRFVAVHLENSQAGATVSFPSYQPPQHAADQEYVSIGCDWMYHTINPYTQKPLATQQQSSQSTNQNQCHPNGTWVSRREFNAMELDWCRDQATNPNQTRFYGPLVSDGFTSQYQKDNETGHVMYSWFIKVGRAVFDRKTGHFLGCATVDVMLSRWDDIFERLNLPYSQAALVRAADGIVVAGGGWNPILSNETLHITQADVLPEAVPFQFLVELVYQNDGSRQQFISKDGVTTERYSQKTIKQSTGLSIEGDEDQFCWVVSVDDTGQVVVACLLPDSEFIMIQSMGAETFQLVEDIRNSIDAEMTRLTLRSIAIGVAGILCVMFILVAMSSVLTKPLSYMRSVAWRIVNHADDRVQRKSFLIDENNIDGEDIFYHHEEEEVVEEEEDVADNDTVTSTALQSPAALKSCTPNSEVTELVAEFQKMIGGFSGAGTAATVAHPLVHEVRNTVTWQSDLQELFVRGEQEGPLRRRENGLRSSFLSLGDRDSVESVDLFQSVPLTESASDQVFNKGLNKSTSSASVSATRPSLFPDRKEAESPELWSSSFRQVWANQGRNFHMVSAAKGYGDEEVGYMTATKSRLFRWILVLVAIPAVVASALIVFLVSYGILSYVPEWIKGAQMVTLESAEENIGLASKLIALYAEGVLSYEVRDLFVWSRIAGWLFFGAIVQDPKSVTQLSTGSEQCKTYPNDGSCPWFDDKINNAPCDCGWEINVSTQCWNYNETDTRVLQKMFIAGQANDADPVTGTRFQTSYPLVDTIPSLTKWWENFSEVPGSVAGRVVTGYNTTYDRIGVFSALSLAVMPLYNARKSLVADKKFLGTFLGFTRDGMFSGYAGCSQKCPTYPHFQSTEANLAFKINNDLCPLGKYGYDPRCRGWFDTGKKTGESFIAGASKGSLYITPPYEFASSKLIASTATKSLFDPRTGEHLGQASIDFQQFSVDRFAVEQFRGFFVQITPTEDAAGGDTVFGPGHSPGSGSAQIGNVTLPYDGIDSSNRRIFDSVVKEMKSGLSGTARFSRKKGSSDKDEEIFMAYEPINIRTLEPVQADEYSRGLNVSQTLVYAIGVAGNMEALNDPFYKLQEAIDAELDRIGATYFPIVGCILILLTLLVGHLSVEVTKPVIILLQIVKNINAGRIDDDIPPMHGGSREVNQVYTSFAKLYKIVRISNNFVFSGNLKLAYHFVLDAYKLFSKISDRKACAIASNNLGNVLFGMKFAHSDDLSDCVEVESVCCATTAMFHFNLAVKCGIEDYGAYDSIDTKIRFAQQLADRLFNRGMFYVLTKGDPCTPDDAYALGYQDLVRAHELDNQVKQCWVEMDVVLVHADDLFDRSIRRLHGLAALHEHPEILNFWEIPTLALDCHRLLIAAWNEAPSALYREINQIGRLQQLEGATIRLEMQRGNLLEAARLSMRMLAQDEFISEIPFVHAAEALFQFMAAKRDGQPLCEWSSRTKTSLRRDLRRMLQSCKQKLVTKGKNVYFCLEIGNQLLNDEPTSSRQGEIEEFCFLLYDAHCVREDHVGISTSSREHKSGGIISVSLECKGQHHSERQQRSAIELAIRGMSDVSSPFLLKGRRRHSALQVVHHNDMNGSDTPSSSHVLEIATSNVMEAEISSKHDSYILYMTDCSHVALDAAPLLRVQQQIEEWNTKRNAKIHILIVHLECPGDRDVTGDAFCTSAISTAPGALPVAYQTLSRVSENSCFVAGILGNLVEALDEVSSSISMGSTASKSTNVLWGVTMEKF